MRRITSSDDLAVLSQQVRRQQHQYGTTVIACSGTGCQAGGCLPVWNALQEELDHHGLSDKVYVRTSACHGFCEQGPLMVIEPTNIFYCHLRPEDVPQIVSETLINNRVVEELLYTDPVSGKKVISEGDIPFYRAQDRVLLSQNKLVNPCQIEDYIAIGGYTALAKVLTSMNPEEVIAEIKTSGLRGRGVDDQSRKGGDVPACGRYERR